MTRKMFDRLQEQIEFAHRVADINGACDRESEEIETDTGDGFLYSPEYNSKA